MTEFLPSALDLLAEGILITDAWPLSAPGPRIIYVNKAVEFMTGYSADELIGETPKLLQCEETDRAALDRIRVALEAGVPITENLMNAHKNGRKFISEVKIVPERDGSGNLVRFISIQRDVSTEIRQQEQQKAREESFRLLFDENPTAMLVLDRKTLAILKVNDAWCRLCGYEHEAALSMSSRDFRLDVPSGDLHRQIVDEASTGRIGGPFTVTGCGGRQFPAMTMRRAIDFEGREAIISTIWDVSEIELARSQVRTAMAQLVQLAADLEARTKELSDAHRLAKVGSWFWDIPHRVIRFSPEVWLLMGRPNSDAPVTYALMRSIIHPDDYQNLMDIYYRAVHDQIAVTAEYRIVYPCGEVHEILSYAEPVYHTETRCIIGLRGTSQDVTAFRAVEAQLRASEDHYRNMVDLHPQIPWTASPDGGVLDAGSKWFELTGMTAAESFPHGWSKMVHPDERRYVLAEWQKSVTTLAPLDIEYRIRNKTGDFLWVRVRAVVRLDRNGHAIRWYGTMEDISERRYAEHARRESERQAARVLNATSDAVIVLNRNLEIQFSNVAAQKLFGSSINIESQTFCRLFRIQKSNSLIEKISDSQKSQVPSNVEFYWKNADIWFEIHIRPDINETALFMRDVSDRKRVHRQLQYAASHDSLTGAPNRAALFEQLSAYLRSRPPTDKVAILACDLDFFKDINDAMGHPVGDALLKLVVNRFRSCIRSSDLLARSGGDEFIVMQPGIRSIEDAAVLANRLISAMHRPFVVEGQAVQIGVSIGIAISDPGQETADTIYKRADLALYNTKFRNRGGYLLFNPIMFDEFHQTSELRRDLRGAVTRGEFSLDFQPIIRTIDNTITGAEALIRWKHPRLGQVSPAQFIPLAEETGYIYEIGQWALREACRVAKLWPAHITVSVNVSVKQIERDDFMPVVEEALKMSNFPAERLLLEVTESVFFSKTSTFASTIDALTERGLRLVLDDFGTGYSSLAYLDNFKFQKLKIDRSFISKIECAHQPMPILEAIMGVARGLGLIVTAEGVETAAQLDFVTKLGCHEIQGYLFSKPLPEDKFIEMVHEGLAYVD